MKSKSRWKKKFAFWPTTMGSGYVQNHEGEVVWLEPYWELEYFHYGKWTPYCGGVTWTKRPIRREDQDSDPPEFTEVQKAMNLLIKLNILGGVLLTSALIVAALLGVW